MSDDPNDPQEPVSGQEPSRESASTDPASEATPSVGEEVRPLSDMVASEPAPSRSRATLIVTSVIAAVALVAAGAVVVLQSAGDEPSIESLAPADVAVFLKVSLSPSNDQKLALRRLLERFPDSDRDRIDDAIENMLNEVFEDVRLSYSRDIKPWVGDQLALAIYVPEEGGARDEPTVVGLITVEDEAAARDALGKVQRTEPDAIFEVSEGVAYLAETADQIDEFQARAAKGPTIGSSSDYQAARDRVGGDGLAIMWIDGERFARFAASGVGSGFLGQSLPGAGGGSGALALRAEDEGLVIVGHTTVPPDQKTATGRPELAESAPASLLGSMTLFDLGTILENAFASLQGLRAPGDADVAGEARAQLEAMVRQTTGLDLDRDILSWMRGEISVVVGGFSAGPVPDIGVLIEPTDEAALGRAMAALRSRLPALGRQLGFEARAESNGFTVTVDEGFSVVARRAPGRLVVASNRTYAQQLLEPGSGGLGDDVVYKRVFGERSDKVGFQMYVRVDRIRQLVEAFTLSGNSRTEYEKNVGPLIEPLEAFAMRATVDGDETTFRIVLTLSDR